MQTRKRVLFGTRDRSETNLDYVKQQQSHIRVFKCHLQINALYWKHGNYDTNASHDI